MSLNSYNVRILFFTMRSPSNGSSRIHAFQFGPIFESFGAKVKFNQPFPKFASGFEKCNPGYNGSNSFISRFFSILASRITDFLLWDLISTLFRIIQLFDILRYDVIILQKGLTKWFEHSFIERIVIKIAKFSNKPFIYHFDDRISGEKMVEVSNYLIRNADLVVTVNDNLLNYALELNKNSILIPENIHHCDIETFDNISSQLSCPISIGWIGSGGGYKYEMLDSLGGALKKLTDEFKLKIAIISDINFSFSENNNVVVENIKWTPEIDKKFNFDIGINPVPYEMALEGKGSYKLLKYMSLGIPSVSSWTPDKFNRNGETCLIASNENEWYLQIKNLISNESLRATMSSNGIKEAYQYSNIILGQKYFESVYDIYSKFNLHSPS